jgi:uroporphyrinogen-III synthase
MAHAVVTRDPARAAPFLAALEALGLVGLAMPVTATVPGDPAALEAALRSLADGELVALASARAAEQVVEAIARGRLQLPRVGWWAVGESSAAPLRRSGYAVSIAARASAVGLAEAIIEAAHPGSGSDSESGSESGSESESESGSGSESESESGSESGSGSGSGSGSESESGSGSGSASGSESASAPPLLLLAGRRILLPRAEDGRDEAALALRAAGARVDELIVYRTVPTAADAPSLQPALARWLAGEVAVAALFAPSQVAALAALLAAHGRALASAPTLFAAIGETTAAALGAAGAPQICVASAPTPEAMANAVAARYSP